MIERDILHPGEIVIPGNSSFTDVIKGNVFFLGFRSGATHAVILEDLPLQRLYMGLAASPEVSDFNLADYRRFFIQGVMFGLDFGSRHSNDTLHPHQHICHGRQIILGPAAGCGAESEEADHWTIDLS